MKQAIIKVTVKSDKVEEFKKEFVDEDKYNFIVSGFKPYNGGDLYEVVVFKTKDIDFIINLELSEHSIENISNYDIKTIKDEIKEIKEEFRKKLILLKYTHDLKITNFKLEDVFRASVDDVRIDFDVELKV